MSEGKAFVDEDEALEEKNAEAKFKEMQDAQENEMEAQKAENALAAQEYAKQLQNPDVGAKGPTLEGPS